jgi:transmembrane sensor
MTEVLPDSAGRVARQLEPAWGPERSARNLERIHRRRRRRPVVLATLAAAALATLSVLFLRAGGVPSRAVPSAPVAEASASPKTTFADGSVARVSDGGELIVKLASSQRIESVLVAGAADFEVSKRPEREFVVRAGPVQVQVVGTRFRVERSGERTHISVSEGKVRVLEGEVSTLLEAGESRFFPSQQPMVRAESSSSVAAAPSPAPAPAAARERFLDLARGGQYKAAYQVMSQSPAAIGSSAEDLMLAADAARLSGHPEQALGYLRRVTGEHPGDSRAPLSAFTQGRVLLSQLGRPAEAAEAFALSRRLRPSGSLAEDALAREAEARSRAGSETRARALAEQYVARYPGGKHLSTMRALLRP